ncbi:hypothetical protein [Winogradskyella ursingii]|uniref:hypothetical protein n=1 Tax=Winogradskyella ursingii TaxID=2686079 RepID=UPI0015CAEF11|nr:hypothetical protein [Winogradskyella ursingii]
MKHFKRGLSILTVMLLAFQFVNAQDAQPTMFVVHTDHVKFNMIPQYEEASKKLNEQLKKHNSDAIYTAISVEDGRYVYVSPIENMSDLDENPMTILSENMDKDELKNMFDKMDECYDSHYDYVLHHSTDLSYIPEGYTTANKNAREYHFLYYSPKNAEAMNKAMADVKKMFNDKGIKSGYNVYHSGFGSTENYYMVEIAGEDSASIAMGGKENNKMMGEDGDAAMYSVISLATKYDQVRANVRPDLSYTPQGN